MRASLVVLDADRRRHRHALHHLQHQDGYFRLFPRYARAETRLYYPKAYPQPVHSSQIRAISSTFSTSKVCLRV